jgi:rhomboid protease GluP
MRKTSGSMLCPTCGKLIGVTEERCPFCGAWRPGMFGFAPVIQKLVGSQLNLMSLISTVCIVLYIVALVLEPSAIFQFHGLFSILSPGSRALFQLGMTGGYAWQQGWWWTLLTAIYLHGGLLHIFFNLLWIRNLGPSVSEVFGPARAFVIFSVAGAAGFLVSNLATNAPSIGASGSIFGLLAALIVDGRRSGASVLMAQLYQWAIVMFVMGFLISGVNNFAHAGGFAGGWVAAEAMAFIDQRRESLGVQILALALLALTMVGFVLSFIRVTSLMLH